MTPLRLRVRELRQAKGWSQEELANRAGATQGQISNLETGKTQRWDLPVLDRIAKALGVHTADLIERPKASRR